MIFVLLMDSVLVFATTNIRFLLVLELAIKKKSFYRRVYNYL